MAKETNKMENEKVVKLTAQGKQKIEEELLELRTVKRKEIAEKIKLARSYGDLSENSEYDEAKNEQAMVEAKIAELEQTLKIAVVIDENSAEAGDKIRHGSVVKIQFTDTKETKVVEIVNSYDVVNSDGAEGDTVKVSEDSPIGSALIGKKAGVRVTVEAPVGTVKIKIVEIVK